MQPSTYYQRPYSPPPPPRASRASNINPYSYGGLSNINFNGIGAGITNQIEKLSNLLKARGIKAVSPPALSPINYDYQGDDGVVKYTRQQFDDLYKTNVTRTSNMETGGNDGYFDKLFFIFQLYIAFINALMNATNMSASMIFGNQSLQNVFSIFLVNVLNVVLKTNVSELTPEQLRDLLEKNRPVLQQISNIIIDEASQLLVGLSDVFSKIAMDWVQNVLPGLVKSAAIGVPSAVEAAIPPLGELVEIINTGMALMASFMKIVGGVQRNMDTVSQGLSHVERAYASLEKIKDLLSQPPSEIMKTATSAVVTPALSGAAQSFIQSVLPSQPLSQSPTPPFPSLSPSARVREQKTASTSASASRRSTSGGGTKKMKHRKYVKNPKHFHRYISNLRKKTAKKELELINSIQELKSI